MNLTGRIPKTIILNRLLKHRPDAKRIINKWSPSIFSLKIENGLELETEISVTMNNFVRPYVANNRNKQAGEFPAGNSERFIRFENKPFRLKVVGHTSCVPSTYNKDQILVQMDNGYVFPIDNDVLVNCLINSSKDNIYQNGYLPGKFIFATVASKVKAIQVNSGLHKALIKQEKKKTKKKLTVRELHVGRMYRTAGGATAIFLGHVNTETIKVTLPKGAKKYPTIVYTKNDKIVDYKISFLKKKLATLWFEVSDVSWIGFKKDKKDIQNEFDNAITDHGCHYRFSCKKYHSFIDEVPELKIEIPYDIVQHIRNMKTKVASNMIKTLRRSRARPHGGQKSLDVYRHYDAIILEGHANILNMSLYGTGFIRNSILDNFKPWFEE